MENKEIQRQKFYDNNIPFDDIDPEIIDIIDVLNFQLDYKTEFCCYGHEIGEYSSIIFDDCVSDDMIYRLMEYLHNKIDLENIYNEFGTFKKWARYVDYNSNAVAIKMGLPKDLRFKKNWEWKISVYYLIENNIDDFLERKKKFIDEI